MKRRQSAGKGNNVFSAVTVCDDLAWEFCDIHLFNETLREWEDYYTYHRPHGALNGQTPYERLVEKTRAGVLPQS